MMSRLISLIGFAFLATFVGAQGVIPRELQSEGSESGECGTRDTIVANGLCTKSYECQTKCCIADASSSYNGKCALNSAGYASDNRKYACNSKKTCSTTQESMVGLIVFLCIICCPCILVLGLISIVAVIVVVLALIFMGFPICLILITVLSGGTAAPFTCGLLCVWACMFCCVVYAIFRMVKNIGDDDQW